MKGQGAKMMIRPSLFCLVAMLSAATTRAFVVTPPSFWSRNSVATSQQYHQQHVVLRQSATTSELQRVPADMEGVPIPFVDLEGNSFIECYADSVANVKGVEYTIGVPCDYSVAICYFDENEALTPVELDDELMEDVFPIAEGIVAEEFGEELALQRTPQTLTLVGARKDLVAPPSHFTVQGRVGMFAFFSIFCDKGADFCSSKYLLISPGAIDLDLKNFSMSFIFLSFLSKSSILDSISAIPNSTALGVNRISALS